MPEVRAVSDALRGWQVSAADWSALSAVTGPPERQPKLAAITADRIETQIFANGWHSGSLLGSQQSLMKSHGIGRPVMREVLRLLELRGVAETRRGSKGGVFVHASASAVVSSALSTCLRFTGLDLRNMVPVLVTLEEVSIRLAIERISPAARLRLRRLAAEVAIVPHDRIGTLRRIQGIYEALAEVTGNAALTTFLASIYHASLESSHFDLIQTGTFASDTSRWLSNTRNLVEAVIVGDTEFAMRHIAGARGKLIRSAEEGAKLERQVAHARKGRRPLSERVARNRASYLAHEIDREIRQRGWPVGQSLGSEPALMKRYGVSRAILRQAIRILETHSVVDMKRGRSGGLFVTSPSASRAISLAISQLASTQIERLHVQELREAVGHLAVELVMQRASASDPMELRIAAAAIRSAVGTDQVTTKLVEFHMLLARLSGNPAIELFSRVLLGLSVLLRPKDAAEADRMHVIGDGLSNLIDAIASSDSAAAKRTFVTHLQRTAALVL